ncbi:SRPBCC domain-containing protein [Arthrobacter sp. M4]|uniref:SRPBCC family protein n=1 Tax=Arthrobacter sp. M4 TaxID=218160 RepID=UPI001CDBBB2E|nr:SRPBCC domain-containing protein [Arthrobacter sp. M4]MCA4133968.1 SRPBCC domain-containing protein [Arthrobacter sp. M4]
MTYNLTVSRVIPASPDEVFDAYTDAEKVKTWFNLLNDEPGIAEIAIDLRVGGEWVSVWGKNPNELYQETQIFRIIDRPRRLVTTSTGSDPSGDSLTTEVDVTFEEHDGGTLMTVVQTGFPTEEMRDFFATMAWNGAFDRIAAFFTQGHAYADGATKGESS